METRLDKARVFVADVKRMAKDRGLNVFVVTDGASGTLNNGNSAVENARNAHAKWEIGHGSDPHEDWEEKPTPGKRKHEVTLVVDGLLCSAGTYDTMHDALELKNMISPKYFPSIKEVVA